MTRPTSGRLSAAAHLCATFLLLVLLCVAGSDPGWAQETGPPRFVRWTFGDARAALLHVDGRTPPVLVGSMAVLAAVAPLDQPLLEAVQRVDDGPLADYLDLTNELGGHYAPPAAAGVFAVSLLTDDARFQDAAFTSLEALFYAGAATRVLKDVFGRSRPDAGSGAYRFDPFSGNTSFPSGHTTAAFALVTPWVYYYPNVATYSLFALSAGTATARVALDKHWPTDVLAGAAVGFFTARYLVRRHQRTASQKPLLTFAPVAGPDAVGFALRVDLSPFDP